MPPPPMASVAAVTFFFLKGLVVETCINAYPILPSLQSDSSECEPMFELAHIFGKGSNNIEQSTSVEGCSNFIYFFIFFG